ncbi:MAG: repeat-containing protein [Schlesneria sp.]|nr:repeat-containing protein [Schlesneria sp.]
MGSAADCVIRRWFASLLVATNLLIAFNTVIADDASSSEIMLGLNTSSHNGHVTRLVIDRHRSQLISVSHDKTIRFWDLATYQQIRVLRPPIGRGIVGELYSANLSPDGKWLAVSGNTAPEGSSDHSILLISLSDGHLVRRLSGNSLPVQDIAFSPDGAWLASAGGDGVLRLWETTNWQLAHSFQGHVARIDSLAWSPDSRRLVTGSWDLTCRFWSLADGTSNSVVAHGGHRVYCVAWSPDGRTVATGGGDRWVKLWEPDGRLRSNAVAAPLTLETVCFSPDSSKLLYGFGGAQLKQWAGGMIRLADNALVASYVGHLETVLCSAFSPDGKYAIFGDCEDHICVWEADTGRLAARLRSEGWPIYATGFSADGRTIGFGYSHVPGSSVQATNPLTRAFTLDQLSLAPTPDYTYMRAQAQWGPLMIHRDSYRQVSISQLGTPIARYAGSNLTIRSRTMLPGNRAAIGLDQSVIVFDALNGKPIYRLPGHLDAVWAVTPSPDQKHLLTGSDDETMQIWNLERYEHTLSLFFAGDDWIAWTPQGYYAASPGGENLMGWHVQRGFNSMATFHPASRFRKRFYRPEIIRRVLSAGGPMQALKQITPANGVESKLTDVQHSLPPEVSISVTSQTSDATDGRVEVRVAATPSSGDAIQSLRLLIDGRPGPATKDDEELSPSPVPDSVGTGQESRMTWQLTLSPGPHQLIAKADSERSIGLSDPVDLNVLSPIAKTPRLFALVVGVSGNQRADLRRTFASADAQAIGAMLGNQPPRHFSDIQVRVVTDPLVTRFNFEEGFRWLQQVMTADDVGVIYFAGQVLRDQHDSLYFQHQESRFGDPAAGLSDHTLKGYLKKIPGKLFLVMDLIARDENSQTAVSPALPPSYERRFVTDLVRELAEEDFGVAVVAAIGSSEQPASATAPNRSVFAQAFLDNAVAKADTNMNKVIDVTELIAAVRKDLGQRLPSTTTLTAAMPTLVKAFPIVSVP